MNSLRNAEARSGCLTRRCQRENVCRCLHDSGKLRRRPANAAMFDVRCLMFHVKSLGDASQASEIMTSVAVHIRHAGQSRTNTAHLRARVRGQHLSKKLVELVMRTDPCPLNCITGPFADSANVPAHSHRPVVRVAAQLLELKRIVPRIFHK